MPSLKVTKWLGDIPIEGACTSCPDARFRPSWAYHTPQKDVNERKMKLAFDRHFEEVHVSGDASSEATGGVIVEGR